MTDNEKKQNLIKRREVDKILMTMFAYYQIEAYPPTGLEIYHSLLSRWELNEIKEACSKHIEGCNWFPKIAELNEILPAQHVPQIESVANVQAAHILDMIRRNGSRYEPKWEDPITDGLMHTRWKWSSLCGTSTEDNEKWFVKEFVDAYLAQSDYRHDDVGLIEGTGIRDVAKGLLKDAFPVGGATNG